MTTVEISLDALTAVSAALVADSLTLRASVAQSIADAVAASVNASQIPLMRITKNVVDTQTLIISLITK